MHTEVINCILCENLFCEKFIHFWGFFKALYSFNRKRYAIHMTKRIKNPESKIQEIKILKYQNSYKIFAVIALASCFLLLTSNVYADLPASAHYEIQSYSFGSGSTNSASANYGLNGVAGEVEFGQPFSSNYQIGSGLTYMMKANVPGAPTLSTPNNAYDRILVVLNTSGNPSDTTYALQISTTSDFSSDVNYIKSDGTYGPTLVTTDYQTYTAWGGASGITVTGLTSNTTYYIRTKARQGDFTESEWGPTASKLTNDPALTFTLDKAALTFNNLNGGNSYTDSSQSDTVTTTTNAINGYTVYGRETQILTSDEGHTINDYASPNSAPTSWSGLGFGYTTSDTTLGGTGTANRFNNGTYYAGFGTTAPGDPVDDNTAPVTNDNTTVSYRLTATSSTPAGTYRNTIIYTIVPSY